MAPTGYQGRSHFRPHIAIDHLLLVTFRGQMKKIGPKSQKLSEISGFQNLAMLRFHLTLTYENAHNLLDLKLHDSSFACKPNFIRRKNHMEARSQDHFFNFLLFQGVKVAEGRRQGGTLSHL